MLVIDFRNKRILSKNSYSVVGNKDSDVILFYSHFVQYANSTIYLKVLSDNYADKINIPSENVRTEDGTLVVEWTMTQEACSSEKLMLQLQFEDNGEIAQTSIASVTLGNTLNISEIIEPRYPRVLEFLQEQITSLQNGSVATFEIAFESDTLTLTTKNADGDVLDTLTATIPLSDKVDKVEGMGLSHNDFTDALLEKLQNIEAGAEVNVLEGVQVDGVDLQIDANKKVNIVLTGKVDKTNSHNKVYGTDNSGAQTTFDVDNGTGYGGNVARRDSNNQLHVPTQPTANDHATSKIYVDTFGKTLEVSINSSTYVMTFTLKDANGNTLATQSVDLPLETMVVDGSYDSTNKTIVLTLDNGNTITIPVADLVSGLVSTTDLATALTNYYTKAQADSTFATKNEALKMVSVTYAELKALRDASQLVKGMQYRIIDYQCTTDQVGTRSMNNLFDIIVTADDVNVLNENARVCRSNAKARIYSGSLGYWLNRCPNADGDFNGIHYFAYYYEGTYQDFYVYMRSLSETPTAENVYEFYNGGYDFVNINEAEELKTMEGAGETITDSVDFLISSKSKLEAWEIKYSFDNDTLRFLWARHDAIQVKEESNDLYVYVRCPQFDNENGYAWAYNNESDTIEGFDHINNWLALDLNDLIYTSTEQPAIGDILDMSGTDVEVVAIRVNDGKGVIYYMKDEWNNECSYDFKNIQYKLTKVANVSSPCGDFDGKCVAPLGFYGSIAPVGYSFDTGYIWSYTFSCQDEDENSHDVSVEQELFMDDEGGYSKTSCNNLAKAGHCDSEGLIYGYSYADTMMLPCIIFNTFYVDMDDYGGFQGYEANTFEVQCRYIFMSFCCTGNHFGYHCQSMFLSSFVHHNNFGNDCYGFVMGSDCYENTFRGSNSSIVMGSECCSNTIGKDSYTITFEYASNHNIVGSGCGYISFGDSNIGNVINSRCSQITFGYSNCNITIGEACTQITFGNSNGAKDYYDHIKISRSEFLYVDAQNQTSWGNMVKNIDIDCIKGAYNNYVTIVAPTNQNFITEYKPANSVTILM